MRVALVFDPDPSLGSDPLDEAEQPRRLGEFIDSDQDALLVWREYGEAFEDGYRTHVIGQGIWESVTLDQMERALTVIGRLPEGDGG